MTDLETLARAAIDSFATVASLAGSRFDARSIEIEILAHPHQRPRRLPTGKTAIYAFFHQGQALKVGMVGANSQARYTSQHYLAGSAGSTLAASLIADPDRFMGFDPADAGLWIRNNTDRINLLLPAQSGLRILELLEVFLIVRWRPLYERRPDPELEVEPAPSPV